MAALIPFRALRPSPESAARVAAVPYDVVSTAEARALASANPLSFLHVSRAEIDLPDGTAAYDDAVYARAAANFERLKADAPLFLEDRPSLYVYRLESATHVQAGVAAGFSVDEYDRGVIRRHERTRADKEDDRTRHILGLRAQTGPVFLTYRRADAVDAVVAQTMAAGSPLYDFVAPDGVRHVVWRVDPNDEGRLIAAFAGISALYIADGHHRAAGASRARRDLRGPAGAAGPWDALLAVAFPDSQVQILAYHRIVRDLNGLTAASLVERLQREFAVRPGPAGEPQSGEVAVYLDSGWHTVALRPPAPGAMPVDALDVSRLQDQILRPIFGIGDVRTDPRIDFVGGGRGPGELARLVASGAAAAAFALHPVSVSDLMAIADAGGIMPPKSTWFEPKLRDGLLSHVI